MNSTLLDPKNFRILNGNVYIGDNSYALSDVCKPRFVAPSHGASGSISFSVPSKNLHLVCLNFSLSLQSYMEAEFRKLQKLNAIAA